jgi:hypothetical protein
MCVAPAWVGCTHVRLAGEGRSRSAIRLLNHQTTVQWPDDQYLVFSKLFPAASRASGTTRCGQVEAYGAGFGAGLIRHRVGVLFPPLTLFKLNLVLLPILTVLTHVFGPFDAVQHRYIKDEWGTKTCRFTPASPGRTTGTDQETKMDSVNSESSGSGVPRILWTRA